MAKAKLELVDEAPLAGVERRGQARVRRFRMRENGLSVLMLRDPVAPVLAYQTWFRVGSRHERPGITGIAHLFEHLMFNQTEHLAAGELDRLIESAGGDTNAATWTDWTYYRDSVPAAELPLVVRLEADRMGHLTLTDRQVESEREVVANERRFRVDDDVLGTLDERAYAMAFAKSPYRWPTIGWMRDIMAISTEDARAFYRTFYAPNNATVILVGDFREREALALIAERYGDLGAAELPREPALREPTQTAPRRARIRREVPADRVVMAWHAPALGHRDHVPMQLADDVLAGGPSSRLHRRLVVQDAIATDVGASLTPFAGTGLYQIHVTLERGHSAAEAERAVLDELEGLAREPITPAELGKARARAETQLWASLSTADGKAEVLGMYETVLGDFRALAGLREATLATGARAVQAAVRRWLRPEARNVVVASPARPRRPVAGRS